MATHTLVPLRGKRIRVTKLDECGRPYPAGTANSWIATNGFISISLKSETEKGEEITETRADGTLCVNEKYADSFKYFTLDIEFCGVNPALMAMVSNSEAYYDYAGDVSGFVVPEGTMSTAFALELWSGLAGASCGEGADTASGYFLLPFVSGGPLDDLKVDSKDSISFGITGAYTKGGNSWGTGPFNVVYDANGVGSPLPTPIDPFDHLLMMDTGYAPPTEMADPQPMPSAPTAGTHGTTATTTTTSTTTVVAWKATTAYTVGQTVSNGSATLQVVTAGTSSNSAPTNPAVNSNVTDGSVTWKRVS